MIHEFYYALLTELYIVDLQHAIKCLSDSLTMTKFKSIKLLYIMSISIVGDGDVVSSLVSLIIPTVRKCAFPSNWSNKFFA